MSEQPQELSDMALRLTAWLHKKMPQAQNVSVLDMEKPGETYCEGDDLEMVDV